VEELKMDVDITNPEITLTVDRERAIGGRSIVWSDWTNSNTYRLVLDVKCPRSRREKKNIKYNYAITSCKEKAW
jgi:hypothetical protein